GRAQLALRLLLGLGRHGRGEEGRGGGAEPGEGVHGEYLVESICGCRCGGAAADWSTGRGRGRAARTGSVPRERPARSTGVGPPSGRSRGRHPSCPSARRLHMLEELVATTFLLFGSVAGPAVVLWLTIALHEIAHAAATWCVGGRVV